MITIQDNDFPVDVAAKIIRGTRPADLAEMQKRAGGWMLPDSVKDGQTMDMFTLNEIKEIAEYLMTYYNHHFMEESSWKKSF